MADHGQARHWREDFLDRHRLPPPYLEQAARWFEPVAGQFAAHCSGARRPLLVGINGAQGSGKSTLGDFLCEWLVRERGLRALSLSIDDVYRTRAERQQLAGPGDHGRRDGNHHWPADPRRDRRHPQHAPPRTAALEEPSEGPRRSGAHLAGMISGCRCRRSPPHRNPARPQCAPPASVPGRLRPGRRPPTASGARAGRPVRGTWKTT